MAKHVGPPTARQRNHPQLSPAIGELLKAVQVSPPVYPVIVVACEGDREHGGGVRRFLSMRRAVSYSTTRPTPRHSWKNSTGRGHTGSSPMHHSP